MDKERERERKKSLKGAVWLSNVRGNGVYGKGRVGLNSNRCDIMGFVYACASPVTSALV